MLNNQATTYYITRNGKLIGPLSIDRVAFCLGRRIFSDADMISSDQLNWISIGQFKVLMKQQAHAEKAAVKVNSRGGVGTLTGNPGGPISVDEWQGSDDDGDQPKKSDLWVTIGVIAALVLVVCGIGVGGYFAYDHFFGVATYTDIKEVYEVISLKERSDSDSSSKKKISSREFWKEAEALAKKNNPLIGGLIYQKYFIGSDDSIAYDKKQREKIFEILYRKGDQYATMVKLIGESQDKSNKRYIVVSPEKIESQELVKLINRSRDIGLIGRIAFQMLRLYRTHDRKTEAMAKEIVLLAAERFHQLKLDYLSYTLKTLLYPSDSHDYKTAKKNLEEMREESKEIKLETTDFKGFGFFLIKDGSISYRHVSGKEPQGVKIDGDRWKSLNRKQTPYKDYTGLGLVEESDNVESFSYKGVTYLYPKAKGLIEAKIRILKRPDADND